MSLFSGPSVAEANRLMDEAPGGGPWSLLLMGKSRRGRVAEMAPAKHDVNCEKQQATDGLLRLFRRVHLTETLAITPSKMRDSVQAVILMEIKVVR